MKDNQNLSKSQKRSEEKSIGKVSALTINFMDVYRILPTPINYSVFYLYHTNENQELNEKIDQYIAEHSHLEAAFIDNLFHEFISNTKEIDKELFSPLESVLASTLNQLDNQMNNELEAVSNLSKITTAIAKFEQFKPIQNIVNFLVNMLRQSKKQREALSTELQQTSNEVNALKSKLEASRQDALIDALTGLYNRRGCEERLSELSHTDLHSSIVIDIDNFKMINDNFGHNIGDKVIQLIAKIIKQSANDSDISVRFGGEEFVVLFVNQSKKAAYNIAEKIRESVTKLQLVQKNTNIQLPKISVSIGVAETDNDQNWEGLFSRADKALYQAKNSGKNRCIIAN